MFPDVTPSINITPGVTNIVTDPDMTHDMTSTPGHMNMKRDDDDIVRCSQAGEGGDFITVPKFNFLCLDAWSDERPMLVLDCP